MKKMLKICTLVIIVFLFCLSPAIFSSLATTASQVTRAPAMISPRSATAGPDAKEPIITSVSAITTDLQQNIVIKGTNFGTNPQLVAVGDGSDDTQQCKVTTPGILIYDDGKGADNWGGGSASCTGHDLVGLVGITWTNTQITISGFGSYLGNSSSPSTWNIAVGDPLLVMIFGPNHEGLAPIYPVTVVNP